MSKKFFIISMICVTVVGSLFTVLASNMFFGDIVNLAAGMENSTLFVTLPAVAISLSFAVAILYLIRLFKHPDCLRKLSINYISLVAAFNIVGLIGCVLSGVVVYGTFVGPNPFPGYLIIFTILHILLIAGCVVAIIFLRKSKPDTDVIKMSPKYVFKTIGWFLFIMVVLNRFGTLLGAPSYIYLRNLDRTFLFYVYLLMPLFIGVIEVFYIMGLFDKKKILLLTYIGFGVNLVLFLYIIIMGMNDTGFISSLSQAMPLERMASKPLEILIHFLSYNGALAALLVQNLKKNKEEEKPLPQE